MKYRILGLLGVMALTAGSLQAQDYDDIYYDASKAQPTTKTKVKAEKPAKTVAVYGDVPERYKLVVKDNYREERDVDEYNRRGAYEPKYEVDINGDTIYFDGDSVMYDDDMFANTRRIERFYNPDIVILSDDDDLVELYYDESPTINLIVGSDWAYSSYGWSSSYYPWYTGWYEPWYSDWYSPWYYGWYSPWRYGWYSPKNCGNESPKWLGKCPACGEWNTYIEEPKAPKTTSARYTGAGESSRKAAEPVKISEIHAEDQPRINLPSGELNRVLGGGLVPGSIVLLGGEPGIGKSTLVLQNVLRIRSRRVLYVSGEESPQQLRMRADRIAGGRMDCECYLLCETSLDNIFANHGHLLQVDCIVGWFHRYQQDDHQLSASSFTQLHLHCQHHSCIDGCCNEGH